jgi:hypothetical protein
MTVDYETIGPQRPRRSFSWSEVWVEALTKPSVETYEDIVADPGASASKAYTWVLIAAFISYGVAVGLSFLLDSILGVTGLQQYSLFEGITSSVIVLMCCAPILSLLAVLGLAINAAISQFVAGILGGSGSYNELVYAFGAYQAPLTLIAAALGAIPYLNCLTSILLGVYGIVLNVIAIKAVNKFDWASAIISSVVVVVGIIAVFGCIVIGFLALLGPIVGDVFSNIIMDI